MQNFYIRSRSEGGPVVCHDHEDEVTMRTK